MQAEIMSHGTPARMAPSPQSATPKTAVALVYWGRLGAGAALMRQIGEAMAADERFDLYLSPSRQSELPPVGPKDRLLAVSTFSGPLSLVWRSVILPLTLHRLVRRMAAADIRAVVTVMPHVWGWAFERAARRAGIRTLLIVHDADPHPGETRPIFDRLVRAEIRASDRVITFSDHVADRLIAPRRRPRNPAGSPVPPDLPFRRRPGLREPSRVALPAALLRPHPALQGRAVAAGGLRPAAHAPGSPRRSASSAAARSMRPPS